MIKVKLGDVFYSQEVFKKIMVATLPFRTVVHLNRLLERLSKELSLIESERIKLVKEFGTEVNGNYTVTEDKMQNFTSKLNELFAVEIEIADVNMFDDTEFEQITLSLQDYLALKPFINI